MKTILAGPAVFRFTKPLKLEELGFDPNIEGLGSFEEEEVEIFVSAGHHVDFYNEPFYFFSRNDLLETVDEYHDAVKELIFEKKARTLF